MTYLDKLTPEIQEAAARQRGLRMSDTFEAWRQREGGKAQRLDIMGHTLADALNDACLSCQHKDVLFLLQQGAHGETTLHGFTIRQGKRIWRHDPETHVGKWVQPLKPDPLFSLPVKQFSPVEPWRYERGADVVGAEREWEKR